MAQDEVALVSHQPRDLQNIDLNRPYGWQDSIKGSFVQNDAIQVEELKDTGSNSYQRDAYESTYG
jgi:hypothetical protein